ncbi:MAG: hypothetical protein WCE94_10510 [Candidatus Methanoperedens sp.]
MGKRLLLFVAFILAVFFAGCVSPDFSSAVFVEATGKSEYVNSIKIVLNPDHTGSMQVTGAGGGDFQGTWKLQESPDVVKVVFNTNGENILITFYQNKEASISSARLQEFGTWYEE